MPQAQGNDPIGSLRAQVSKMLDTLNPAGPIGSTVVFKVQKAKEGEFLNNAAALTVSTKKLIGCMIFGFHRYRPIVPDAEPKDPVQHLIYEEWDSVEHFRKQWDSEHLKRFQYGVLDLVAGAPELNFYGGAESGRGIVLQTGQKRCWDSKGNPIHCYKTGQDGEIRAGVAAPKPRFVDNNDGTVTDKLTGLIWLKDANAFGEVSWAQALVNAGTLANGANNLRDGSKPGEWRMPNVNEMQSLLDLDNSHGPALPPDHPFMNATPANYWSASTVDAATPLGWYCALAVGPPVFDLKFNSMRMWPIKGKSSIVPKTGQKQCYDPMGQPINCQGSGQDGELQEGVEWPTPRFSDNFDGTVKDNLTGLTWLKDAGQMGSKSWDDALKACQALASGGAGLSDKSAAGDWRLPNLFEMRSLIDYSQHSPALPAGHPFQNVRTSLYWSSTTVASAPNLARFVFVGIGPSVWDHKSVMLNVWPVRG